jgi:uncharacterized membrane protein YphA (DoxX/SURF4 family)
MRLNFVTVLRYLLGLVFVFSGFVKIIDLGWFSGVVSSYGVGKESRYTVSLINDGIVAVMATVNT